MKKLEHISTVSSGITFRSRHSIMDAGGKGRARVVQMRDLDGSIVRPETALRVDMKPAPAHLIRPGDIIFRSRGQTYTAALLKEESPETIVAAPMFRIRPDTGKVLPEYLLWWINRPESQAYFKSMAEGTVLRMIGRKTLAELEVRLPPLQTQRRIAAFQSLSVREQELMREIAGKRERHAHGILRKMATGSGAPEF